MQSITLPLPPSLEELWESYRRHLSVHRVAAEVGIDHSTVHDRLRKAGYILKGMSFTDEEDRQIREYYANTPRDKFDLDQLTGLLGRAHKANVCRRAKELGLTDKSRKHNTRTRKKMSARVKHWHATHEHPKGALGMKHTEATLKVLSAKSTAAAAKKSPQERSDINLKAQKTKAAKGTLYVVHSKTTWKAGWHEIGGKRHYFRSSWEVNYAHYLEWLKGKGEITEWEFEPKTFWFDAIMRGTRSYLPDFRVTETTGKQIYHEIKGWMDPRSVTKLKRMKKYHPEVELLLIDAKQYRVLDKQLKGVVPGWGSPGCLN